ncbi:hypothetical protein PPL_07640 [Heterostelium album PN500]|uniref:LNR domain-containing protein n=1 Tax=Heterostelium pallidum (strain ATCC 26659 / Pp 5 / PN500) TaxID=670386 RepID=D3BGI8_HETP5|nr:hypothetical protein PPL_07640 [Heterostelium album PN500]EFA79588.1 hypothetical protein PPL_07640 [Heterostelium album PN500]|eukprot:XP_020431709.1 hypothetical protein PPL_07640 [Heterostelium album PN500]
MNSICNNNNNNMNNNNLEVDRYSVESLLKDNIRLKEIIKVYQSERDNYFNEREKMKKNLERARNILLEQKKTISQLQNQNQLLVSNQSSINNNSSNIPIIDKNINNNENNNINKNDSDNVILEINDNNDIVETPSPNVKLFRTMIKSLSLETITPPFTFISNYIGSSPNGNFQSPCTTPNHQLSIPITPIVISSNSSSANSTPRQHYNSDLHSSSNSIYRQDKDTILITQLKSKLKKIKEKRKKDNQYTNKLEKEMASLEEVNYFYKQKVELLEKKISSINSINKITSPRVKSNSPYLKSPNHSNLTNSAKLRSTNRRNSVGGSSNSTLDILYSLFLFNKNNNIYSAEDKSDRCAERCPTSWIGDGFCDRECNIQACRYDGGDCPGSGINTYFCSPKCRKSWIGDGVCDLECNTADCTYDNGDCSENRPANFKKQKNMWKIN